MVSDAFKKLPLSTEQILHAEKYFTYERPVKVAMPNLALALGRGWRRIDYDVNGEWGYYLVLDQFINNVTESKRAAAGWGGDRFAIYQGRRSSDVFLAQLTVWDTAADAKEFFDAYLKRSQIRYPEPETTFSSSFTDGDARNEWKAPSGRGVMEMRGSRVVILEGIPAKADVNKLLSTMWQQRSTTRKS